jgi:hypothetical protein
VVSMDRAPGQSPDPQPELSLGFLYMKPNCLTVFFRAREQKQG